MSSAFLDMAHRRKMFNLSRMTDNEICKPMESVASDDEDTSDEEELSFFSDSAADPDVIGFPVPSEFQFDSNMIENVSLDIITQVIRDSISTDAVIESSGNLSHDSYFLEHNSQILENKNMDVISMTAPVDTFSIEPATQLSDLSTTPFRRP